MINLSAGSATIYQFPIGGRAGVRAGYQGGAVQPLRPAPAISYDAWYHQDALENEIAEAAKVRPC